MPCACKPHTTHWIWHDFFLQFVISSFIVLLWSRLFSTSGEVNFPPSHRLKSTRWHSKSKLRQITLGRMTPTIARLAKATGLLYLVMLIVRVRVYPLVGSSLDKISSRMLVNSHAAVAERPALPRTTLSRVQLFGTGQVRVSKSTTRTGRVAEMVDPHTSTSN